MRTAIAIMALAAAAACSEPGGVPCGVEVGAWGEMPDLEMHVGDTVEVPLGDHFRPEGCIELMTDDDWFWIVRSADPSAVAVSRVGTALEIAALEVADSVRVTVGAATSAPERLHGFLVRVLPR